jgi:serine/threonine-protein kinase RsbW
MSDILEHKKIFIGDLNSLPEILSWIRSSIDSKSFNSQELKKIELVSEEVLVNIFSHGYKGQKGEIIITIINKTIKNVKIIIMDKSPKFNPLLIDKKIDSTASLEEKEEGGLGIFFIKHYVDEVFYQRKDEYNVLTLIKFCSSKI